MKSRTIGMPIRVNAASPIIGRVTDSQIDGGIEWITIDDNHEERLADFDEVMELTGPPVGPYLRRKEWKPKGAQ